MRRFLIVSTFVLQAAVSSPAFACDTCGCSFNPRQARTGVFITTPTASTLGKGHGSAGFLFEYQRFNSIPARDAHTLHHQGVDVHGKDHQEFYDLSLGYGLLDDLDLYVIAPIVSKTSIDIESHARLGEKDAATGFGDLRLVGKYRFWKKWVDAALLLGLKTPTGQTDARRASGEFETEQQPGSGSWDWTAGLAVSRPLTEHLAFANAFQYTARGEGAKALKLGDLFRYNVGLSYALRRWGAYPNVSAVVELHHEWARRDHSREEDQVLSSGGTTVLVAPGLAAQLTNELSAFVSLPVPVYQNLGGQHEELTLEVLTGVSWHF